jgi:hypothetical protein
MTNRLPITRASRGIVAAAMIAVVALAGIDVTILRHACKMGAGDMSKCGSCPAKPGQTSAISKTIPPCCRTTIVAHSLRVDSETSTPPTALAGSGAAALPGSANISLPDPRHSAAPGGLPPLLSGASSAPVPLRI